MRTASERAISLRFQARTAGAIAERRREMSPGLFLSLSVLVLAFVAFAPGRPIEAQVADKSQDLSAIGQIREEGLTRSHVMSLASALCDDIGPRLSGSPEYKRAERWALEVLNRFGVANAHREGFGVFGSPWTQLGTSVLLEQPTTATILAQATPWSPSTPGEVHAEAIEVPLLRANSDFAAWHSRLRGKIILYGAAPRIQPNPEPSLQTTDAARLRDLLQVSPTDRGRAEENALVRHFVQEISFQDCVGQFFYAEGARAVLRTNMEGNLLEDDSSVSFGALGYLPAHQQKIPSAVINADAYGRIARLLERGEKVALAVNIQTRFGQAAEWENVIAEIPGSDPWIGRQVVMAGAHLDSWASATGATDDGAGVIVVLEAFRILRSLGLQPRRTIRLALWGGEEQGLLGSMGYVRAHLADIQFDHQAVDPAVPDFLLPISAVSPKTDYSNFDAYFNIDNGTGKLLGIYAENNLGAADRFRVWAKSIEDLGFSAITLRGIGETDHVSFDLAMLPAFQFLQDSRDYETRTHHTTMDTYERLSEPDLKQAATVLAVLLWDTSQSSDELPRKRTPHIERNQTPAQ